MMLPAYDKSCMNMSDHQLNNIIEFMLLNIST